MDVDSVDGEEDDDDYDDDDDGVDGEEVVVDEVDGIRSGDDVDGGYDEGKDINGDEIVVESGDGVDTNENFYNKNIIMMKTSTSLIKKLVSTSMKTSTNEKNKMKISTANKEDFDDEEGRCR